MDNVDTMGYFLQRGDGPWREVTKVDWVRAERSAGFRNTLGKPDEPGTGGFGGHNGVNGRIVNRLYAKREAYDLDPEFQKAVWPIDSNNIVDESTSLRNALQEILDVESCDCDWCFGTPCCEAGKMWNIAYDALSNNDSESNNIGQWLTERKVAFLFIVETSGYEVAFDWLVKDATDPTIYHTQDAT